MTIQAAAKEARSFLESKDVTRDGEKPRTIIVKKDDAPDWVRDLIRDAHGDRFPDDDIYARISEVLDALAELDPDATGDDAYDRLYQIEPDIYTTNLTAWLASNVNNVGYIDNVYEEYGSDAPKTGTELLQFAQRMYIGEIADSVLVNIAKHVELAVEQD